MSYIEQNLMNGENVLYKTKLHWMKFLWAALWLLLSFLFFRDSVSAPVGVVLLIISGILGLNALVLYLTSEFGLTDKRVILKSGTIRRDSLEILLTKVESIQVNQGILGRVFGYGTLMVGGTGSTKNIYPKIANPFEFRKKIQEQLAIAQAVK